MVPARGRALHSRRAWPLQGEHGRSTGCAWYGKLVKRAAWILVVTLIAAGCSGAPAPAPREAGSRRTPDPGVRSHPAFSALVRAALESREAHRLAASLSDDVGPRLAGSKGDAAAVIWAERAMRGLQLVNVHLEPVVVPVWRRGEERARIVGAGVQGRGLDVSALGWSGSTAAGGIEADVVHVTTVDDLAKLGGDALRGKIVFVDSPMRRTPDGSGYGEAVPTRYRAQTLAGANGASAVLIRSVGTDDLNPHTGSTNRGAAPGLPIGALSNASADLLARELAAGPVRLRLVLTSERMADERSANVVGELRGTRTPEDIVLLAAHLDSWDTGRGALDDGAGCGVVLDAIRLLATEKPARTVRVVLFAAEENSAAGGRQYAAAHADEVDRIALAVEVDGGTDRVLSMRFIGDPAMVPAVRSIAEPLAPLGVRFNDGKGHPGVDVQPLVSRGVPIIDLRQDSTRYFDVHHTRGDTSDKLDAAALAQVTAVVAHVASRAADATVSFGRVPESLRVDE